LYGRKRRSLVVKEVAGTRRQVADKLVRSGIIAIFLAIVLAAVGAQGRLRGGERVARQVDVGSWFLAASKKRRAREFVFHAWFRSAAAVGSRRRFVLLFDPLVAAAGELPHAFRGNPRRVEVGDGLGGWPGL
jgi:hypothetical protein